MPAALLFALAPLSGEYLLGNLKLSELALAPFIAPLYGGGAVLIREITRRAGRGYPTMLMLGIAYALFEEGLVDQLFFNPHYFAGQDELMQTPVPGLGVDLWLTLILIAMHMNWSICIPIILVEALFAGRGAKLWLGKPGVTAVALVFVSGSAWLTHQIYLDTGFMATAPQLLGVMAAIVTIVVATAFGAPPRTTPGVGASPGAWFVGAVAFAASSLFMLTEDVPGWWKVAACLLVAVSFFVLLGRWATRQGWTPRHTLAAAAGGALTYAWLGAFMTPESGPKTTIDHVGTVLLIGAFAWLFAMAFLRLRRLG